MRSRCSRIVSRAALRTLTFSCAFLMPVCLASAQAIVSNPTVVAFVPSDDHDKIDENGVPVVSGYEMEFFVTGDPRPVLSLVLGKPRPALDGVISLDFGRLLRWAPLPGWVLEARVVAVGPEGRGASDVSNPFRYDATWAPIWSRTPPPNATTIGAAKVRR
ncbi:MAG: hypothetical protein ACM3NQ_03415 [Bacteroidales bacterium]